MTTPTETAARRYIDANLDADPEARARHLEAAFAENGRLVGTGSVLRGRAAVLEAIERVWADPRRLRVKVLSVIHCQGPAFRFRSVIELPDGALLDEWLDVGEVDSEGRIITMFSFRGPLADAAESLATGR